MFHTTGWLEKRVLIYTQHARLLFSTFRGTHWTFAGFDGLSLLLGRERARSGSYLLKLALAEHSTGRQELVRSGLWQSIFYWSLAIMKYSNILLPFQLTMGMTLMSLIVTVEWDQPPLETAKVIPMSTAQGAHSYHTVGSWLDLRHSSGGDFWSEFWNMLNTCPTESAKLTTGILLGSSEFSYQNCLLTSISPNTCPFLNAVWLVIKATALLSSHHSME